MEKRSAALTPDLPTQLRETAAEFIRIRGALQSAEALAVVNASPATKARLAQFHKRAATIQSAIEQAGRVVDGARHWFQDTFGSTVEETVPMANPAIGASIQASVAAMNYFLRDAKAELDRIVMQQKNYEAMSPEQKDVALNALHDETAPVANSPAPVLKRKWVFLGLGVAAVAVYLFGGFDRGET